MSGRRGREAASRSRLGPCATSYNTPGTLLAPRGISPSGWVRGVPNAERVWGLVSMQGGYRNGLVDCEQPHPTKRASTSSGSRDKSLEESDNLPDPDVLFQEIVEDLEVVLEQFRESPGILLPSVLTEKKQ